MSTQATGETIEPKESAVAQSIVVTDAKCFATQQASKIVESGWLINE